MSYTYHEAQGSPTVTGNSTEGWTAQRRLIVPWVSRHALIVDLLGPPGALYPYLSCGARAVSATAEPYPGERAMWDGANATYETAIVTVNYSTKTPATSDLVSETLEPTSEFLTQDHALFLWGSGDLAEGVALTEQESPGRLQRGLTYVLTYYHLPAVPVGILSAVGCVNSAPITAKLLGLTFDAETLLFSAPNLQRKFSTSGTEGWQVTYRFVFKPGGWNTFWRSSTASYESIYLRGESAPYKQYPLVSYAGLVP